MPLLEVTNGPTPPTGLTLTADTQLVITYDQQYTDGVDSYSQIFRADYDVTNGTWKPQGTADGTTFYIAGAANGDPVPPRVQIVEYQAYSVADGTYSRRDLPGGIIESETPGTWDYASLPQAYSVVSMSPGDFNERVDDRVAALLTGVAPIALTYDDVGNSLSIAIDGEVETASRVVEAVKNVSAGLLVKGTPIHQTGATGNTLEVVAADASNAALMPAVGVLLQDLNPGEEGTAVIAGKITGVSTVGFLEGDVVYVAAGGGYTKTKPSGEGNLVQNIGIVTKVGENGGGVVMGSGRSAATSNLNDGNIFIGNASNYATTASLEVEVRDIVEAVELNAQTGTTYELALVDAGKIVTLSNAGAITLTVPAESSVNFDVGTVIAIVQSGAGTVTVSPAVGVTVSSKDSLLSLSGQYATASLVKLGSDSWLLSGGLA